MHYQLARLEANAGRLAEARQWAELALQLDLLCSEAHYILGLIHQEQGETEQAIARFKKVLYLDPDFVLAHFGLANLYQKTGQTIEAARHGAHTIRLISKLPPDSILPGSDDLTAGHLLAMVRDT